MEERITAIDRAGHETLEFHTQACSALRDKLGVNIYGKPLFRVIRSDGRREYFGDKEGFGPKYAEFPQTWILERWHPPEHYGSKADWELADLGPWPRHGDYEIDHAFTGVEELSPYLIQFVCRALMMGRSTAPAARFSKIKEREDQAKAAEKERIRSIVRDAAHCLPGEMTTVPTNFTDTPKGSSLKGHNNV